MDHGQASIAADHLHTTVVQLPVKIEAVRETKDTKVLRSAMIMDAARELRHLYATSLCKACQFERLGTYVGVICMLGKQGSGTIDGCAHVTGSLFALGRGDNRVRVAFLSVVIISLFVDSARPCPYSLSFAPPAFVFSPKQTIESY